ncbi:MAG: siphovirus Gp157 family protein [Acidobacteriaceae bacterium]
MRGFSTGVAAMPKLHEITAAYSHIDALIDDEALTNEQLITYVEAIEGALQEKSENIAKLIQNLEAAADSIKGAESRMAERRKALENRAESIRSYLLANMVNAGITKIECPFFKIAVRSSPPSVVVIDGTAIPGEYMRQPEPPPPSPDKKKILDDLKQGVVIDGVRLEADKKYLQIR